VGKRFLLLVPLIAIACGGSKSKTVAPAPAAGAPSAAAYEGPVTQEQSSTSRTTARKILGAAAEWTARHSEGVCPTVAQLKADGAMSAMANERDAWGRPFMLVCTETEAEVRSDGPDGHGSTHDDVREKGGITAPAPMSGPPTRADLPSVPGARAFDAQLAMDQVNQRVVACETKTNEDASMRGKAALHVAVRADGTIKEVVVVRAKTATHSPRFLACVLKEVAKMQFGATPSHDEVTFEY
jgi:hypothetical protein